MRAVLFSLLGFTLLVSASSRRAASASRWSSVASGRASATAWVSSHAARARLYCITRLAAGGLGSLAVSGTVNSKGSLASCTSQPLPTSRRTRAVRSASSTNRWKYVTWAIPSFSESLSATVTKTAGST